METNSKSHFDILDEKYDLTQDQIAFYQENKFIKLKQVLSAEVIEHYSKKISDHVASKSADALPLEKRTTYDKAFLQVGNIWTENEEIKNFVFSKRLASIATQLMQVDGVRMYHDQALFKEPGGGFTPWHADQYYWPLGNDNTVTAWIPMQETPLEMGPLEFSAKSHLLQNGRDLKISDDSEQIIEKKLRISDFDKIVEPFDLGEVSFHSGWLFHRAGANTTEEMRQVMTVIYMDKDMPLKEPKNKEQEWDWNAWCKGAKIGEVVNTPLNPILYSN